MNKGKFANVIWIISSTLTLVKQVVDTIREIKTKRPHTDDTDDTDE